MSKPVHITSKEQLLEVFGQLDDIWRWNTPPYAPTQLIYCIRVKEKPIMAEIYKIRSTVTGLYSGGGAHPSFNKGGKIWKTMGHLTNHLSQLDRSGKSIYERDNVEIVTFEVVEKVISTVSIADHIRLVEERKTEQKRKKQQKNDEYDERKRLALYKQLRKEFS